MAEARGLCCSVCYNNFKSDEVQFVPRNLICGHTYCTGCLNKLAFQARNPGTICCPTCKTETALFPRTFESVRNLPKNFGVLEILEGKEEVQTEGIQNEKEKNKYLCPEHGEALKVFCYTDNCLICIYCQVYGKHAGHKCELATDIATTTREELRSWSKKLGESYDLVKKSRKKVIDTKDSIVNTQQYVRGRIMKHMGVLNACMRRREVILKCDVDDKTKQKLQLLDAQESAMTDIVNKCEEAYALIQRCQNNDSALVEEKFKIERLVSEVSALLGKCELEPAETDNLTYYFEYDIAYTLENTIGEIRLLKPGQKEEPLAGINKHELLQRLVNKETKDACSQTEELQGSGDHPLFQSLLQGLEEIVHTGLTTTSTDMWESSPPLQLHVHESESSDSSGSEELDGPLQHSDDDEHNDADDIIDGDDDADDMNDGDYDADDINDGGDGENEVEPKGAVGGFMTLPTPQRQEMQEPRSHEETQTSLLDELQKEIDRLRLLSPEGNVISLTDGSVRETATLAESEDAIGESAEEPQTNKERILLSSSDQQETLSLNSTFPAPVRQSLSMNTSLPLPGQTVVSTDGFSLDSQHRERYRCAAVNCQNPSALASLRCQHCCRPYCPSCAPLSLSCHRNPCGHSFVSNLRNRGPRPAKISRAKVGMKKPKIEEGLPWQCNRCTMLNGPQVLVCLGCDALRESEAQEGRNVCPMCTLVNEPGKTKCELCNTELVSKDQVHAVNDSD